MPSQTTKPQAAILTLGCKVNQFESSSMAETLRRLGYDVVEAGPELALAVINTCTVTQKADQEILALMRRLKRQAPDCRLVLVGCLAQSNPQFLADSGLADLILGQNEKANLAEHLAPLEAPQGPPQLLVSPLKAGELAPDYGTPWPERTRVFYKIQDGCSASCTYCAVPSARGPSRSLPLAKVLDGLKHYIEGGLKEAVLCGIHLGLWGRDFPQSLNLARLLHAIEEKLTPASESFRLRLSSIEPLELDDELLCAYESYPWLASHFHLPLQSGSDRILKLMNRPYNTEMFTTLVNKLHQKWPRCAIGVDIMVGFPGETEADFRATEELLTGLPLAYFHVFPYSPRPGTIAAASSEQVPEHLKRARALQLKELNQQKRAAFSQKNIGQSELALLENTPHRPSGRLKILTGNYLTALLPPDTKPFTKLQPITLKEPQNPWKLLEAILL